VLAEGGVDEVLLALVEREELQGFRM